MGTLLRTACPVKSPPGISIEVRDSPPECFPKISVRRWLKQLAAVSCAPVAFCLARVCQASRPLLAERPADIVRVSVERPRPAPMGCSPFCTNVHSFPQPGFQIPLAKKNGRVYSVGQIEPGSLKNLTAQLKEGAAAARQLRPQCFLAHSRLKSWVVLSLSVPEQLPDAQARESFPASRARAPRVPVP